MHVTSPTAEEHLDRFLAEKLPVLAPGIFEGAPDEPSFTLDQRNRPLGKPPYPVN